jgi:DedD protein
VPELTHDSSDDGFHEIQLSGKQLVFLFMSTTVVLVVTFLCGVLVGRNVRTDRPPEASQEIAAPADVEDDPPLTVSGEESKPLKLDELNAQARLTAKNPAEEPRPKEPPPPSPAEAAAPTQAKTPPPTEQKPVEQNTPRSKSDVPTAGRSGTWFLQVAALSTRDAAAGTVRQLVAKGYPAYLDDSAPPLFRVRVGRYGTRDEAARVAQKLQKEEQFTSDIRR